MKQPCKHCDTKHGGCHAECQIYDDWKKEFNRKKEIIDENRRSYCKVYMLTESKARNLRNKLLRSK